MASPTTTTIGNVIEAAVKQAGSYSSTYASARSAPSVISHLVGGVKDSGTLAAGVVKLNPGMMSKIEHYLESVGVPVRQGLTVLKADSAAESLVLTANALEGTEREVVIKLTDKLGIFKPLEHLEGNALHIREPLMAPAVQTVVDSLQIKGAKVLVRVEPKMVPVDTIIESLPGDKLQMMDAYTKAMERRIFDRSLKRVDVKSNNFALHASEPPVKSFEDLLTRDSKCIDVGSLEIHTPKALSEMKNPVPLYKPVYAEPPKHIDDLFKLRELPLLDDAHAAAATRQAQAVKTNTKV